MEDWSDTPIYAQMMAEKAEQERLEAMRVENPIYVQVIEETKKKEKLMESWQRSVVRMREAFDLPNSETPRTLSPAEAELHIKMIRDEFEKELVPALMNQDLVEIYDSGIDVIVYVIGMLTNAGFDIDPGFREIMRNNMTKVDPETGKVRRAVANDPSGEPEGKVLKPEGFVPVNLHPIINAQFAFGPEDDTVYRTEKTPITLGIGGPKIGEGDLHMDHNGNMEMQGIIFDLDVLPAVEGMSILGVYEEPQDEIDFVPEDSGRIRPVVPEGWPEPDGDESPSEMFASPYLAAGLTEEDALEVLNIDEIKKAGERDAEAMKNLFANPSMTVAESVEPVRIVESDSVPEGTVIWVDEEVEPKVVTLEEVIARRSNYQAPAGKIEKLLIEDGRLRAAQQYMAQGEQTVEFDK
jgi:predicted HAD superfamily Cof-like phosphohydrolase